MKNSSIKADINFFIVNVSILIIKKQVLKNKQQSEKGYLILGQIRLMVSVIQCLKK